jgi:hypothetical protein
MQLFVLGIPCIYSGTEQALIGRPPEPSEKDFLPDAGIADYYLREAMFGPEHPRKSGLEGLGVSPEASIHLCQASARSELTDAIVSIRPTRPMSGLPQ